MPRLTRIWGFVSTYISDGYSLFGTYLGGWATPISTVSAVAMLVMSFGVGLFRLS
jgi:hypothetical protein